MKRPAAAASPPLLSHKKPVAAAQSSSTPQVPPDSLILSRPEAVVLPALGARGGERAHHGEADLCRGLAACFGVGGMSGGLIPWETPLAL